MVLHNVIEVKVFVKEKNVVSVVETKKVVINFVLVANV